MLLSKERNIPENDKCIICKKYITIEDIRKKDYEVVITKISKKKNMHIQVALRGEKRNERIFNKIRI